MAIAAAATMRDMLWEVSDLTPEQHAQLEAQIERMMDYLVRLRARMIKRGISRYDETFENACRAHDALHELWRSIHFSKPRGKDDSLPF
jgi:hypothetical protein